MYQKELSLQETSDQEAEPFFLVVVSKASTQLLTNPHTAVISVISESWITVESCFSVSIL